MTESSSEYEKWKGDVKKELDSLVARNFIRLFNSTGSAYNKIWGEISRDLHHKYDLMGVKYGDPDYTLKHKKQYCIYINIRIYSEKIFPWELSDPRTYRFVKQHSKLPNQDPDEWKNFEAEATLQEAKEQRNNDEKFDEYLKSIIAEHPEYTYR